MSRIIRIFVPDLSEKMPHIFNYELMKAINGNKQMSDVWRLPAIAPWEKLDGKKHPTQKPLSLLTRIILASTTMNGWVLDPFAGSSTTGIAANLCGRRYLGIEQEQAFAEMSKNRREQLEKPDVWKNHCRHLQDLEMAKDFNTLHDATCLAEDMGDDLPF